MPKKKTKFSSFKKFLTKSKKKINHPLLNKLIGLLLIGFALFVLVYKPPAPKIEPPKEQKESPIVIDSKLKESKKTDNIPVRILIPNSDIDLTVTPSRIINGYWELSETTASYGMGSGMPGSKSNTVLFAHAREGLFYNLKDVKQGDIIYVFTKDSWYRYKVNKITEVYPNQIEVIQPTKNETITLYTCTGFNDEKRLIISATPSI